MFGKLWQQFSPQSSPEPIAPLPITPITPVADRTDAEYEALFLQLLEGVSQGWGRGDAQGFLVAKSLKESELIEWLQRFADRILAAEPDRELAERLVALGRVGYGELSRVAGAIGQELLERDRSPDPIDSVESYLNQGDLEFDAGNFREAIACYDQALAIKPDLHEVLWCKGNSLFELGDYQAAIACYDQALAIKPDLHEVLWCKGNSLFELGDYQAAIACYDQALAIKPDLHEVLWCKGNSLFELGDYQAAIACYDQALAIKPDLHEVLWCKGNSLFELGDYQAAIACYDQALAIKPAKREALALYNKGVAHSFLGDETAAIACYDQALQIKQDISQAWENRGIAMRYLPTALEFSLLHIALQNRSLNQPGYEGERANYTEGLKHVDRQTQPEGWGNLHQSIGRSHYYQGQFASNPRPYYRDALKSYQTALETLTEQAFPEAHLKLLQDMIRAYLGLDNTEATNHWRSQALRVLGELINKAPSKLKPHIEAKFSGFSQIAVDVLVQDEQAIDALETAERYKNRRLTQILQQWQEQTTSPSYANIRQLVTPTTAVVYWHLSDDRLTTFLLIAEQPEPIVFQHNLQAFEPWQKAWNTDYDSYRGKKKEAAKPNHPWRENLTERLDRLKQILDIAAFEPYLQATHLILIPHRDLHCLPLHALFSDRFHLTYLPSAQVGLTLRQTLRPAQAIALLNVDDPAVADQEPLPDAQLESAVIRQLVHAAQPEANPPHQVQAIAREAATKAAVTQALESNFTGIPFAGWFHFTGHGEYNPHQPEASAIALAGTDQLTVREVRQLDLTSYDLVSIAACETALTGRQAIDTEYVGLVSAFLQAGAAQVISTLWKVDESASAWLMIYFYQRLLAGQPIALALQQAQDWLRTAKPAQLLDWLKALLPLLDSDRVAVAHLSSLIRNIENKSSKIDLDSDQPPYADPYYWAAFTLAGIPSVALHQQV